MRPVSETAVISANTSPAPPMRERAEMYEMEIAGNAAGFAEYMFMGETTTRFCTTICPTRNGVNIGGGGSSCRNVKTLLARTVPANHYCTLLDEVGIAQTQVLVGDSLGARQHAKAGLDRLHAPIARRVFGPQRADIGGVLGFLDVLSPRALKVRQRLLRRIRAPSKALKRLIASSMASLVPEPIEKCAVCSASPSSTMFL